MTAPVPLHVHPAKVVRWVDADTVWLDVDKDHRHYAVINHRMLWIQAPERYTDAGKQATARVNELAPPGTPVVIRTFKAGGDVDSFGRWLAEVFVGDTSINQLLLAEGHAVPYQEGR